MSQLLTDNSEVVFEQSEETAEAMEQEGLISSRRKEETELEDTQPHDGTRQKAMEFDRPVEEELEAAWRGVKDNVNLHSDEMSDLRPEQQIQNEEETRTPPRREPQRMESQQPRGPHDMINGVGSVPGYVAAQRMYPAGRNRPYSEWSPVEKLEGTVSRMQRDMENLQTENRFLRTRMTTGPVPLVRQAALTTTKVPWFSGSTSWEQYQQVFDAIALSNGWGDATAALQLLSHL